MHIALWLTHRRVAEWTLSAVQTERFATALPGARITRCATEAEFRDALRDAEVALTWRFAPAWLDEAPRLRLLSTPAAGHEYMESVARPGLAVHYGSFHGAIMGETALALMLGFARRVLPEAQTMRGPSPAYWPREQFSGLCRRLCGAHVVVVGFGNIGRSIARLAKPFGARITGVRRHPSPSRPEFFDARDCVVDAARLDSVLPTADHVVLALPDTPGTYHLLDAKRLALLRPSAYLYNLGRGNAIDETALCDALSEHRIAGAALDVFGVEPLALDSPLRTVPNCLLFPHASAIAPDYLDLYLDEVVQQCLLLA